MKKKVSDIIIETVNQLCPNFEEELLDGDEVEIITERSRIELDLAQGNITRDDYDCNYSINNWKHWFKEEEDD